MTSIQTSLHAMTSKIDTIGLVTIGRDNAEGLRSEYQRHAFATAVARASTESAPVRVNVHRGLVTGTARVPFSVNSTTDNPRFRKSLSFKRVMSHATSATGRTLLSVPEEEEKGDTMLNTGNAELLILLPTFIRRNLKDNTE